MNVSSNSSVQFTSLKPKLRMGQAVLTEINQEMGYLQSSSKLSLRKIRLVSSGRLSPYSDFAFSLMEKADIMRKEIYDSFITRDIFNIKFKNISDFRTQFIKNILGKGGKANCWENMMLVYTKMLQKGIKAHNLEIRMTSRDGHWGNHFVTIFGLEKNADVANPKTWGNKAILVDAWSGLVKPAKEGLLDLEVSMAGGRKVKNIEYKTRKNPFITIQHKPAKYSWDKVFKKSA